MSSEESSPRCDEPVTAVFSWQVLPGKENDFRHWAHGITRRAVRYPGHQGVTWLRPESESRDHYAVLRFADPQRLSDWMASPERAEWQDRLEGIAVETSRYQDTTGMETWFHLPGSPAPSPPRWKMVVVTFCAVYPLSMLLGWLVTPEVAPWPLPARAAVFPAVVAPLLTYIVMPWLSRLLRRWLYE
ncbi:antibiotic biosynthesis monooxygenase [Wenjunlia tyrosinilytica]|jgi:antibiotic biosynthesis monooxygenase (ABM) superfamily enzyme|uniref:ABM domain-containing protein n=1 Tax=Wenjunlia tyrosinilytica TaxID=1544741 RepID=A0A918DZL0_9ACTN|nr:antibiotic biosynthesis monooxygenase [Wenjunlia tyrosinilytica]GGO90183.1 hypothetical protein GCM10012280_35120 [Wenjunlia tyrosinilytica]